MTSRVQLLTEEGRGKTVAVDLPTYISLLIKANVTDPELWPPGMEEGAKALARIREIETRCIKEHGEFDWGKLPPEIQDEYDNLCALLDRMQEVGEPIPWESYKARRKGR